MDRPREFDVRTLLREQYTSPYPPPPGLLEMRVMELERWGLCDTEEMEGVPSSMRQYAIASLQRSKPPYFITFDDKLLKMRDHLEGRYGVKILSVEEAVLLLQDTDGPPN